MAYLPTVKSNTEPIGMIIEAGKKAGYTPGKDFAIGLDVAASEFYREYNGKYYYWYRVEGKYNKKVILGDGRELGTIKYIQEEGKKKRFLLLTSQEQLEWAIDVCKNPDNYISSVEDFFDQNDLWGNRMLTKMLQDKNFIASLPHEFQRQEGISHVGDDISTSNIEVIRAGIDGSTVILGKGEEAEKLEFEVDTISDLLLKLNQIGTIEEIMESVEYLRSRGRTIVHSHRGKEPSKETIRADVALASTTYPSRSHDRTGVPAKIKIKYATYRKERSIVYDYLRDAYDRIERKVEEVKIEQIKTLDKNVFDALTGKEFDSFVDSLKDVKIGLVIGANTILENAGTIETLKKKGGAKIAVWAKDEATVKKLKAMGVEEVADILTSKGLKDALNQLRIQNNIGNVNIVLINSPEDLENIEGGISEFLMDEPNLTAINVEAPKEGQINDIILIFVSASRKATRANIPEEKQALVATRYEEFIKNRVDNNIISPETAEALKSPEFITSLISVVPLVKATMETANSAERYKIEVKEFDVRG